MEQIRSAEFARIDNRQSMFYIIVQLSYIIEHSGQGGGGEANDDTGSKEENT